MKQNVIPHEQTSEVWKHPVRAGAWGRETPAPECQRTASTGVATRSSGPATPREVRPLPAPRWGRTPEKFQACCTRRRGQQWVFAAF